MFIVQIEHADGTFQDVQTCPDGPMACKWALGRCAYWRVISPSGMTYDRRTR